MTRPSALVASAVAPSRPWSTPSRWPGDDSNDTRVGVVVHVFGFDREQHGQVVLPGQQRASAGDRQRMRLREPGLAASLRRVLRGGRCIPRRLISKSLRGVSVLLSQVRVLLRLVSVLLRLVCRAVRQHSLSVGACRLLARLARGGLRPGRRDLCSPALLRCVLLGGLCLVALARCERLGTCRVVTLALRRRLRRGAIRRRVRPVRIAYRESRRNHRRCQQHQEHEHSPPREAHRAPVTPNVLSLELVLTYAVHRRGKISHRGAKP